MSELIKCAKCSNTLTIPTFDPFVKKCSCGTVYERSSHGDDIYSDTQDFEPEITSSYDKIGNSITTVLLAAIPIALVVCALLFVGDKLQGDGSTQPSVSSSREKGNPQTIAASSTRTSDITIYSGTCTNYKKEIVGNQMKYTLISEAFGKVVINHSAKKFSFYYDSKLIYSGDEYLSYVDDQQGGEGFTLTNGYSAHSLPAEKTFHVFYNPEMGEGGTEYTIKNYKIN